MHTMTHDTPYTPVRDISIAVMSCIAVNALIFVLHWDGPSFHARPAPLSPPDWLIGLVWVGLFACMGVTRFRLRKHSGNGVLMLLTALTISDLAYPFYALAFHNAKAGLVGNALTIILATVFAAKTWRMDKIASTLVFLQVLWVLFASLITLQELGVLK